MQNTFGLVSTSLKDKALKEIQSDTYQLQIAFEKQIKLSVDNVSSYQTLLQNIKNLSINERETDLYGFILEGSNAIEDWLNITRTLSNVTKKMSVLYGSANLNNAKQEVEHFKNYVKTITEKTNKKVSTTAQKQPRKSAPTTKKEGLTIADNAQKKKKELRSHTGRTSSHHTTTSSINTAKKMPTSSKTPNTTSANSSNPTNSLDKKTTARSNSLAPKENSKKLESKNRSKISDEGNDRRRRRGNSFLTNTTHSATNATSNTSSKRLLIAKGGVTKNTPPVSVLTGRTRKQSRSTAVEKKPILVLSKETVKEEEEQKVKGKDYCTTEKDAVHPIGEEAALEPASVNDDDTRTVIKESEEGDMNTEIYNAEKSEFKGDKTGDNSVTMEPQQQTQSHSMASTTCSTLTTTTATIIDEHDAEVAATIGKSVTNHSDELAMPPLLATTQTSGRSSSSFSPTLARPETPEVVVDQLRLRFESILSASAPQTPLPSSKINRKSVISPEFASRVKEMKPRNPVGTRVKNMVDFFMDENLHKWEF